ncbi:DUF1810 family protein [Treponema sp.]|uniref:DUF1810 family protein n=1 Tax=Treponema sp. TaxID=166 RepID=UPI00388D4461
MYGAILGDIIGEPYEFDGGDKTKDFPLFDDCPMFTDDTVMTVAVCDAVMKAGLDADESEMKSAIIQSMHRWGQKYPDAGYGGSFYQWLTSKSTEPYGSYGNGSAMRVSSIGWFFDTMERTREVARWSAEVTHNHPEGIKGAEATASVIWLARTGSTKEQIKEFVAKEFGYDLSRTIDEIRPDYCHDESCQRTVPEAISAFLEGESFEDVVRTAVSLGGDTDTLADIAAAMAEAYYDIPEELIFKCGYYTTKDMFSVFRRFDKLRIGRVDKHNLLRFKKAQESDFKNAVKELMAGCKRSHWMWYVFPQLKGLGLSDMSNFYGISGIAEAQAYLDDGLLGSRYKKLARLLLGLESDNAEEIFGQIDAIKLKSSMTLFDAVDPDNMLFNAVLNKFFNGERDRKTLELLKQ